MIPTPIRSNLTLFITYYLNDIDWDLILQQIMRVDKKEFKEKIDYIFDNPKNFMLYRVDTNKFFKNFELVETQNPPTITQLTDEKTPVDNSALSLFSAASESDPKKNSKINIGLINDKFS